MTSAPLRLAVMVPTLDEELALAEAAPAGSDWRPPSGVAMEIQSDGDLGARMRSAFDRRFADGGYWLVGQRRPGRDLNTVGDLRALAADPTVEGGLCARLCRLARGAGADQ